MKELRKSTEYTPGVYVEGSVIEITEYFFSDYPKDFVDNLLDELRQLVKEIPMPDIIVKLKYIDKDEAMWQLKRIFDLVKEKEGATINWIAEKGDETTIAVAEELKEECFKTEFNIHTL